MRRYLILIPFLWTALLGGCAAGEVVAGGATMGGTVAAIAVFQRTPIDAVYSLVSGRDCSVVRWDRGLSYCRAEEPPPVPPPFCSRSLGGVDCWRDPTSLANRPRELADGPRTLTAAQEAHRTRRWPFY